MVCESAGPNPAQQGLTALARSLHAQARASGLLTVAITGSSGKTSTKDLLAQVLAADGPTVSPLGSFNNELGTPLTVCQIDEGTRYLVSEMGSRAQGDIAHLCSIVTPSASIVLNVGTAHLGEFGSREAIARAKGEIVEALDADGWAVLNADDELRTRCPPAGASPGSPWYRPRTGPVVRAHDPQPTTWPVSFIRHRPRRPRRVGGARSPIKSSTPLLP